MSNSRLILAVVIVFVLIAAFESVIHTVLLHNDYQTVAQLFRATGDIKYPLIFVADPGFAIGAVWIYSQGVEAKPWFGQGIRFGIALAATVRKA